MTTRLGRLTRGVLRRVRALVPLRVADGGRFVVFHVPRVAPPPARGVVVELGRADLPRVATCRAMADPAEGVRRLARRFDAGARAFGLQRGERLLGYCWGLVGAYLPEDADRYRMQLAPGDTYLFDAWLEPQARGRDLFEALIAGTQVFLERSGARRFVSTVATANAVSLRVHARIGATPIETVTYGCVAGLKLHVSSSPVGTRVQFGDRDLVSRLPRDPEAS